MNAKRISAIAAAVLATVAVAAPAQAAAPSHQRHIDMAHEMVEYVFDDLTLSEQVDICLAYESMPSYFIKETSAVMTGLGMSSADKRKGITSAMNEACAY